MWIQKQKPAVVLAPMEGVTDYPMRVLLTRKGGFSHCVTEFIRISQDILPDKVFLKAVPELGRGGRTPSGVPVQVQLLGGDPEKIAETARQVVRLGALGVDLNFGCPAPTVNRRDAGATLLKYPQRIYDLIARVRDAVPGKIPVSAKLRLGWDRIDAIFENSEQVQKAGASWITIHARTKVQGYAPPVHWGILSQVRQNLKIPVVVNGDIGCFEEYLKCKTETGASHFMLGRGALANPHLAALIEEDLKKEKAHGLFSKLNIKPDWPHLFREFADLSEPFGNAPGYSVRRIKQWANLASKRNPLPFFEAIKSTSTLEDLFQALEKTELSNV